MVAVHVAGFEEVVAAPHHPYQVRLDGEEEDKAQQTEKHQPLRVHFHQVLQARHTCQPLGTQPEFDVWGVAEVSDNAQAAEGEVKHLQAEEGQNVARAISYDSIEQEEHNDQHTDADDEGQVKILSFHFASNDDFFLGLDFFIFERGVDLDVCALASSRLQNFWVDGGKYEPPYQEQVTDLQCRNASILTNHSLISQVRALDCLQLEAI